ncbi:proline--tRNA ligase [bacterium I07]|nr:proline--tRNA ligase [bacterium I07]
MQLSKAYIPTQKEIPADAVIPSHQLMLRAGLIKPLAAGVYSHLPMGWKVMKKVMQIIREEMDKIGGQELHLPVLNPIELWDETGRNTDFGDEMFRLKDRRNRTLALAPTHEEIICDLARKFVHSYHDLPQIWYQIQTKFRDEPRPRSGVLRTRQFMMKDSYTLDRNDAGLDKAYDLHARAYKNIFTRCGLKFHIVDASSGLMGGSGSQEFMIESSDGEDTIILCNHCDYAANLEIAASNVMTIDSEIMNLEKVHTPDQKTIDQVSGFLNIKSNQLMKSLVYVADNIPIMVLVRGDHEMNEVKLQAYLGGPMIRQAHPDEVQELCGAQAGYVGPIKSKKPIRLIADLALKDQHNLTTGANENSYHFTGIELERDVQVKEFADIRGVNNGDQCINCGNELRIIRAVELGHIFKLGTKYSRSMKAGYLDNQGHEKPIVMGSYGIGVERIVAAAIEQNYDERGMVWSKRLYPYLIHIIPVQGNDEEIAKTAEDIYKTVQDNGFEALVDDRDVSPGYKFKDADLLGMPLQIILGGTWKKEKKIEIKIRQSNEKIFCQLSELIPFIQDYVNQR